MVSDQHIVFLKYEAHGWLQGMVAHFLHRNPIFCKVVCIYMLLTWHTNNNFPNL